MDCIEEFTQSTTGRSLDQRDGSQALGDVGKEPLPPRQC